MDGGSGDGYHSISLLLLTSEHPLLSVLGLRRAEKSIRKVHLKASLATFASLPCPSSEHISAAKSGLDSQRFCLSLFQAGFYALSKTRPGYI